MWPVSHLSGTACSGGASNVGFDANGVGNKSRKVWYDPAGVAHSRRVNWIKDGEEYFVLLTGGAK